jgi:micrococcal nuclease
VEARRLTLGALIGLAMGAHAGAEEIRVIDGDSLAVGAEKVRIMGVDTAELHHARCAREYALAMRAKEAAEALVAGGGVVIVRSGRRDRYGRVLADVSVRGVPWLEAMRGAGATVREYAGGRREGWC